LEAVQGERTVLYLHLCSKQEKWTVQHSMLVTKSASWTGLDQRRSDRVKRS